MYAVVKSGGHQYKVGVGDKIVVNTLTDTEGSVVNFAQVLCHRDGEERRWGNPCLNDVEVLGKITKHTRQPKVVVFKYNRRKNYKRTKGWKQPCSEVEITSISRKKK